MSWTVWIGALAIGLVLGLLGSGGSILAVPVLVYLAGEPAKLAIAESLAVVFTISSVGALPFAWRGQVAWKSVLLFGVPAMAGAYGGAFLAKYLSGAVQMVIFAVVMLVAAGLMVRQKAPPDEKGRTRQAHWKTVLEGVGVGLLTGLVGVGGGFLIVPVLVLLVGLPMHLAVGTSLVIIALNAASGFAKHFDVLSSTGQSVHWGLIGLLGAVGIVGSFAGGKAGQFVPQAKLKKGFAVFLVVMGLFVLWQNLSGLT
jgi:uncharacterized membrane protein YfcA